MQNGTSNYDFDYFRDDAVKEPESCNRLNHELNMAYRLIEETGTNLFLTGKAGTGKTTFLRRLKKNSSKRMIVLAPTGVAAINAEGTTLHSFFQLSFSPFIPGKGFIGDDSRRYSFSKEKRRIIAALDLLVIDEISMVRPDTLDAVDMIMRRYRNPALPFGGVQLLLIGDLRQLAPVLRDNEKEILRPFYDSEYFFDSIALRQSGFTTIELTTVFRQSDNDFINILNEIRDGVMSTLSLSKLNSRYLPSFIPPADEKYIRLTTHNRIADNINFRQLEMLNGSGMLYKAYIKGNFPDSFFPADSSLRLKIGAQVMFIKNDTGDEREYYNGMIGTVTNLSPDHVTVKAVETGREIIVRNVEWENTKYIIEENTKKIIQITEGTFSQLPLRLAWAITIHKSQGLTFDRAIIDVESSFAPGQTYVALSRCRSMDGLVLSRPISISSVITDPKVNSFIQYSVAKSPDENFLLSMRAEYTRQILAELFNFRALKISFDDYHKAISEYVIPHYPEYYEPFKDAQEKMSHRIDMVGARFTSLYASSPISPEHLERHPDFLEKIKNGCKYFIPLLKEIRATVLSVKVQLNNAAHIKKLSNIFDSLVYLLNVKTSVLDHLADSTFTPSEYIDAKAKASIESTTGLISKSSGSDRKKRATKRRKSKN